MLRLLPPRTPATTAAILIACSASPGSVAATTPFVHETVDATGNVGRHTSLALDARGNPHISYSDLGGGLKYASKVSGTWAIETVEAGGVGDYTSLALDAQGTPRISYHDYGNSDLKYTSKSGATWTIETVDAIGDVGAYTSLALDAQANPRISYQDIGNLNLKYASKSGGTWTTETVDAAGEEGWENSLAVDALGNPHISWYSSNIGDLKYASKSGGIWMIETVAATGDVGRFTSLALDVQGNPRISYSDFGNGDLRYASKSGATWAFELVDATGNVGEYTSLALDAQGNPRISYWDIGSGDLKYASKSGGTWAIETVDATGNVGEYTSLALDAQGNPRISYLDNTNFDLRYTDSALHVLSPGAGDTWPVGGVRTIAWSGAGLVSILISPDGGASFTTLLDGIQTSPVEVRVPHLPTRFARVQVLRSSPLSAAFSDSFFTIQSSVALLSFTAEPASQGASGSLLAWRTDPGPEDLAGYRLERALPGAELRTLVDLTRETSHSDPEAAPQTRYRLFAVNGLGEELLLGEASLAPARPLAAWPLPYQRGGTLNVSFATAGGLGGLETASELAIFDPAGRRVRTVTRGVFGAGYHSSTWDGLDERGEQVAAGTYFLRLRSAGFVEHLKLLVTP